MAAPTNTRAEFLARIAALPLEFEPGSTFAYGLSHELVGFIVEEVSGRPLDRFLRDEITGPLGMADTGFVVAPADAGRVAQFEAGQGPPMRDPWVAPARFSGQGNVMSTALDWSRLCRFLLGGGALDGLRVLSRKSIELMTADHLPPGVAFDPELATTWGPALPGPLHGQGFGFALAVRTHAGRASWHGSVGDFGWVGGWGTFFWADPREDLFAVVMTQAPAQLVPLFYVARSAVYAAL